MTWCHYHHGPLDQEKTCEIHPALYCSRVSKLFFPNRMAVMVLCSFAIATAIADDVIPFFFSWRAIPEYSENFLSKRWNLEGRHHPHWAEVEVSGFDPCSLFTCSCPCLSSGALRHFLALTVEACKICIVDLCPQFILDFSWKKHILDFCWL